MVGMIQSFQSVKPNCMAEIKFSNVTPVFHSLPAAGGEQ